MEYRIEFHKDNIFKVIKITPFNIKFLQEEKEEEVFKGSVSDCKAFIDASKKGYIN